MRRLLSPLLLALTLAGSPSSAAPEPPVERQVRLTRRAPGAAHRPVHAATIVVDLDALTQETRTVLDHRGQTLTVQGVPLSSLLAKAPKDRVVDAARLRFKNGTEVLLPLSRAPMLDVFIARRFKHSDQAAFTTDFDPVPLGEASWRSPRSLVFSGNRVFATAPAEPPGSRLRAVGLRRHPRRGGARAGGRLAGRLRRHAGDPPWPRGVARPLPDLSRRPRRRRLLRLGLRAAAAAVDVAHARRPVFARALPQARGAQLGLAMPPQPDVTREETDALHAWMTALSTTSLRPYAPPTP